ncbi:hypothetical protein CN691_03035 [Bacillus pseudomycoides]|nr:hypothetical protein CN691_03035 [Bacillus pseudomycoides]
MYFITIYRYGFPLVFGMVAKAGGLGASPLDLNVTEYGVSLLLRTIELAVRRVQLLVQVEQLKSSFLVCSAWQHSKTRRI